MEMIATDLVNFRDLGGTLVRDGRRIAPKRLLRCGELSRLTDETVRYLQKEYHVKNIVDLRTLKERQEAPDCAIPGSCYHVLDFFPDDMLRGQAGAATGSGGELLQLKDVEQVREYMKKLYATFITGASARAALQEFIRILLRTEDGATLFHCFAGKDRTGIAAAVILTILGAPRETIMKDYLKTNRMRAEANRRILTGLREKVQTESTLKAIEAALCVEAQYLETCFETAETEYGSFEQYIEKGLQIGKPDQEKLRERYLAG